MTLQERVAVVTGAARGIGEATVHELSREGARVVLCDIDRELVNAVAADIRARGGDAIAFAYDIAKLDQAERLVSDTVAHYGRLDILVNNAAICPRISIEEMTEAAFDQIINVNLKAVFFLSRAAAEAMKARRWGRIVNLSSTAARIGGVLNATVYGASKAGIVAMTKSFARHYAPYNILVNSVAPGAVHTRLMENMTAEAQRRVIEQVPLKRLSDPAEIARVIAFLSSDAVSWMTGATVDVNGGSVMV